MYVYEVRIRTTRMKTRESKNKSLPLKFIPLFLHSQNKKGDDLVAQLVEHITFNDGVLGSSPNGITKSLISNFLIRLFYFTAN